MPVKALADPKAINLGAFFMMCRKMRINSKRMGPCPLIPTATQRYLISEIVEGLNRGIHWFVVLKCRQANSTTIVFAFLVYWLMRHPGMKGLFAIDDNDRKTEKNLEFREMCKSLEDAGHEWCVPMTTERREIVGLANGSKLLFDNANKRQKGTLGRSVGLNLFHGSEVGFWNDEKGLMSLMSALDGENPNRLYVFESTACGFNLFHRMCERSQASLSTKFIFIGWWRHDWYRIERGDQLGLFEAYWDGQLNDEEELWVKEVKARYGFDIQPEQMAWFRKVLHEEFDENLNGMYQEYPPLPEYAFRYGGSTFFDPSVLTLIKTRLTSPANTYVPRCFRFKFGSNFLDTTCEECEHREGVYHLRVWDPPVAGEGVMYSMGVDPAYGMSETSDYGCIQLLRCYEDAIEQVAEFAARGLSSMHLAWAILYLYGAYSLSEGASNVVWNVELQGGGAAVINTVEQIQQDIGGFYDRLGLHFDSLRAFAYKRVDGLSPNYSAKHWQTNQVNRDQFLHHIKSYLESGFLIVRSEHLLDEMSQGIRGPSGIVDFGGKHDDLVMAMGIAVMNYWNPIRFDMEGSGYTFAKAQKERELRLKGAEAQDLIALRVSQWMNEKRDEYREREEQLKELLEENAGY